VLSDVNMPGSGLELALRFKSDPQLEAVPVVLISATLLPHNTKDDLVLAAGATKFLRRPIDPGVLLQEIESCLTASRQR
jgi:CheY-like chemotaxis protein